MKSRLLTFGAVLALLAALGSFYAKPLMAQVRAALVANVDEPARAPFQVTFDGSCPADSCYLQTQPVPGKRLHVTHIASYTTVPFSAQLIRISALGIPQTIQVLGATSAIGGYFINANVDFYLDPGEILTTSFKPFSLSPLTNTVTGYLVDCTAASCAPVLRQ